MPQARNSAKAFGWVSRVFHWGMAIGIFGMLGLGTVIGRMEVSLGNLWLFGLHKSLGISLLLLVLLRLIWHRVSPPPASQTAGVAPWQSIAARISHRLLYVLMLAVPLSGWAGASATGIDTVLFNRWTLPGIAPVSPGWESAAFASHWVLTRLLLLLLVLHIAGALHHHFVHRDSTLRRMFLG